MKQIIHKDNLPCGFLDLYKQRKFERIKKNDKFLLKKIMQRIIVHQWYTVLLTSKTRRKKINQHNKVTLVSMNSIMINNHNAKSSA